MARMHFFVRSLFEDEVKLLMTSRNMSLEKALFYTKILFPETFGELNAVKLFDAEVEKGNVIADRKGSRLIYKLTRQGTAELKPVIRDYLSSIEFGKSAQAPKTVEKSIEDMSNDELLTKLKQAGLINRRPSDM